MRTLIARLILAESPAQAKVGSISLQPHQISAVTRLQTSLDQFGGALLCDEVGMGKTYVATAIAQRHSDCLVVAPSSLTSMWRDALTVTRTTARLITFEALSRADTDRFRGRGRRIQAEHIGRDHGASEGHDLIVVDEAHHVRNPGTNRFFALASLARGARVLLLSATPIHNRRADLVALLSLFLGSRAHTMSSAELTLCVVRREQNQLQEMFGIPEVLAAVHHQLSDDGKVVDELTNLPPPLPVRDGGLGGVLIGRGLVHQWASSEAALHEAVRRRIARAIAMCASLEAGTYPTERELETWTYGDGALQLGFPELLSTFTADYADLLAAVRRHLVALESFHARFGTDNALDAERAQIIARIRSSRPGAKVVAFAQYSETVSILFRELAHAGRVAMLTSHGARVSGGALTRNEAIGRFAPSANNYPPPGRAESIDLLLTTDLLSEGVNLQDANVVIHLDLPWTPARMEQRVGRVARMGSQHKHVHVHLLRPPRSAEAVLGSDMIVRHKWNVARSAVGTSAPNPLPEHADSAMGRADSSCIDGGTSEGESLPLKTERLRSILRSWLTGDSVAPPESPGNQVSGDHDDAPSVATVRSPSAGFIASVSMDERPRLIVCVAGEVSADLDDQIAVCSITSTDELPTDPAAVERTANAILTWCAQQSASAAAGIGVSSAVRRKEITKRIDSAIQRVPPHLRSARSAIAARARRVATTQQCASVEMELASLLNSDLPADEWLNAIAALESASKNPLQSGLHTRPPKIQALLLLRAPES
ncbi:MAG: helicase-related protein [Gemmatimonadaceae bacterium]